MPSLGERMAQARRAQHLTLLEVAQRTGLQVQHINRLEKDHRVHVRSDTLAHLAAALKCSTDYLVGLTDDPTPHATPKPKPKPKRSRPKQLALV